jgi:hypothetical protein
MSHRVVVPTEFGGGPDNLMQGAARPPAENIARLGHVGDKSGRVPARRGPMRVGIGIPVTCSMVATT